MDQHKPKGSKANRYSDSDRKHSSNRNQRGSSDKGKANRGKGNQGGSRNGRNHDQKNEIKTPRMEGAPFQFVSNTPVNRALTDAVLHDRNHKDTFSGELRCELTTESAAIFAGYQKVIKGVKQLDALKNCHNNPIVEQLNASSFDGEVEKRLLYPLVYNDQTLIAGSSIKGMLRHSISALTAAPMLRVQEQTYSFRPNLQNLGGNHLRRTFPAVVHKENPLSVRVVIQANKPSDLTFISNTEAKTDSHTFSYNGGLDNKNMLSKKKARICFVQLNSRINIERSPIISIDDEIQRQYDLTTKHLRSEEHGHISSRHPDASSHRKLSDAIKKNREIKKGQLIYVEAEMDSNNRIARITSYGNNYYYHWRYKDTLRTIGCLTNPQTEQDYKEREETSLSPEEALSPYSTEEGNLKPSRLNIPRALFGFVPDDNKKSAHKNNKLAGRISVNHALEVQSDNSVLKQDIWAALAPTGSPRASAVEFYVQQDQEEKLMSTYGDDVDSPDSKLNGRKFYLHHDSSKARWKTFIHNPDPLCINNKLAPIATNVSPEGTKYRFAVSFRSLRNWELGLVIAALNPDLVLKVLQEGGLNLPKSQAWASERNLACTQLGNKLGYGRPYGFGSCSTLIKHIRLLDCDTCDTAETFVKAALEYLAGEDFDDILLSWMKVHNLHTGKAFGYPEVGGKVFSYHFGIRKQHLKNRRLHNPKEVNKSFLPIL